MDQLPTDQQEALRKTNTQRLRIMAAKTYDVWDDELEAMDRTALLDVIATDIVCLLYTSPSPRDRQKSRMPSSA